MIDKNRLQAKCSTWNIPLTGAQPVSYTHLDVYKRQIEAEELAQEAAEDAAPENDTEE